MKTETARPGIRERKAAKLKIQLVEILREKLKTTTFTELNVEDLCEEALISKVTFFKYFPTKEAIIHYATTIWMYHFKMDVINKKLEGLKAIEYIFIKYGEDFIHSRQLLTTYFASAINNSLQFSAMELTLAEKMEIFPMGENWEEPISLSMGLYIEHHLALALQRGEIKRDLDLPNLALLIGCTFNGAGILGLRLNPSAPGTVFKKAYQAILQLIQ